jgi:cardiolipin synthase
VHGEQLYRLAPSPPRRIRLGTLTLPDHAREFIRAWWTWFAIALVLELTGLRVTGLFAGLLAFVLYHTSTDSHPAVYPLEPDFDSNSSEFRATIAGTTGMPIIDGNRVTVYNDGDEFYPAILDVIESARLSITMEQYIFWDGRVGKRFAEALAEKSREGVPVKLLVDAIGSATLGKQLLKILEAGGCQLAWFRPIHWYTLHRANQRNHRKSLIIDGGVAFTGGAGIADHWVGAAESEQEWRDIQVRVEGRFGAADWIRPELAANNRGNHRRP